MPRNYNATLGITYIRVSDLHISNPDGNATPSLTYTEREAIVDAQGHVHYLDTPAQQFTIEMDRATGFEPIQAVLPATGEAIEGRTYSLTDINLALTALVRANQQHIDALQA